MNETFRPTTVLLDKSVVREALRGQERLWQNALLPERQRFSLTAIVTTLRLGIPAFISEELLHILLQPHAYHSAQPLLRRVQVFAKGRYLRRWARRLRDEGFSPEDAVILSHASFGVNDTREVLGAAVVLTTDYALQARYDERWARIHDRFQRMTRQLQPPYREATLPRVYKPEELLETLLR